MLNIFYNQWIATAPELPPSNISVNPSTDPEEETSEVESYPEVTPNWGTYHWRQLTILKLVTPEGTNGWESFSDGATQSTLSCGVDSSESQSGSASLRIDFHIEPDGWGTCPIFYDSPPNFKGTVGCLI